MYQKKHIHFIGIGGIGMSGIATILRYQGYTISGCDLDTKQESIKKLTAIDCTIHNGNNTSHCQDPTIDIVVYSSAVGRNNPEIIAAQQRGIPTIPRALMLAELMRTKWSIAVAGSHGKTTTTSLISHILIQANLDPTVIIGGHLKNISTNARLGASDFLVAEADESDRSLLQLQACLAIITNIDLEHLETYKDLDDIKQTFIQFLNNLPFYGKAIVCTDDPVVRSILPLSHLKIVTYSLEKTADFYATDIQFERDHTSFVIWQKNAATPLCSFNSNLLGRHNVLNTLAAVALALELNVPVPTIQEAISSFKGVERRFSFKGCYQGAELFDDYGHHPKEILNTLYVAKRRAKKRLVVVFQPHRYTRTDKLWNDFIETFISCAPDHLVITDIYAASEKPIANITSELLVKALQQRNPYLSVTYIPYEQNFAAIIDHIKTTLEPDDLLLLLGAGKINTISDFLPLQ